MGNSFTKESVFPIFPTPLSRWNSELPSSEVRAHLFVRGLLPLRIDHVCQMRIYLLSLLWWLSVKNSPFLFWGPLRHTLKACEVILSWSLRSPLVDMKPKVQGGEVHVQWWWFGELGSPHPGSVSPPPSTSPHPTAPPPPRPWHCGLVPSEEWQGPHSECRAHFLISCVVSIICSCHRYPSPGQISNEFKVNSPMPHPSESELEVHTLQRWALETSVTFLGTQHRLLNKCQISDTFHLCSWTSQC